MRSNDHNLEGKVEALFAVITGCIAIFTFITGIQSLSEIPRPVPTLAQPTELPAYTRLPPTLRPLTSVPPVAKSPPSIYDVYFCDRSCIESSAFRTERAKENDHIYAAWTFRGLAYGTPYKLIWYVNRVEWARSNCIWRGSGEGSQHITIDNEDKLGGDWTLLIEVDGHPAISATVSVPGTYSRITPIGEKPCPGF